MSEAGAPQTKAERTRQRIVDAALELFRENGYDATTMRMVADRADVSLGNAYYYFASKDLLLQAFYLEVHEAHVAAAAPALARERGLRERLLAVLRARLDVIAPYHHFSALMFRIAADPKSPLNPFHRDSAGIRREGEALFAEVLRGSRMRIPADLAAELPSLLWTYSMGILLFWIHDDSPGQERTRAFVERTVDLTVDVVKLAANPLLARFKRRALGLFRDLLPRVAGADPAAATSTDDGDDEDGDDDAS